MTQEFHISVTPVGENDYLVRTEQVAPGVPLAEELVRWSVDEWLTTAGQLMDDPLKSVLQGEAIARNSVNLVALGHQLYDALFQGTLRDSWITAQGIAQNHQQVLRLRLGLKDSKLARLPWEVMHFGDRPIATGPHIAFSRYQSGVYGGSHVLARNISTPQEEGCVRVLMVIASPTDQTRLNLLKLEAIGLREELHRSAHSSIHLPEIQVTLLEQPGREELTQALEQGRYHVLHYSGHSNVGPHGGQIYLVSTRTGLTETLSGDDLAGLLVNNNIQMAVFNSCRGAYGANSADNYTGEQNLTESLVKRGIKTVLAMSERIPDEVALTLTQLFYRNLSQGNAVDLCVSRMRQGLISAYGSHQMYWALPILYLQREFDGHLAPGIYLPQGKEVFDEYSPPNPESGYFSPMADDADMLALEEMIPSMPQGSSEMDWLGEETWGDIIDEIEYDDPSYSEDSAIVSDLWRQLDSEKAAAQTPMTAELVNYVQEDNFAQPPFSNHTPPFNHSAGSAAKSTQATASLSGVVTDDHYTQDWLASDSQALNEITTTSSQKAIANRRRTKRRLTSAGVVGVGAIATILGFNLWWGSHKEPLVPDTNQIPAQTQTLSNPIVNLKADATGIVTAYASENLNQGDLEDGLAAVEELLDRNALSNAETVLANIPQNIADKPYVHFLKGRLAWQSVQTGDSKYNIDDARRYWESASKADPDSFVYKNALGFAYYAENDLNRANDAWLKALDLAFKRKPTQNISSPPKIVLNPQVDQLDALNAYAGLALGLYKSAQGQPLAKQEQYLNEAIKLRKRVFNDNQISFQVHNLSKNWLWTENTIADWQSLLELKN